MQLKNFGFERHESCSFSYTKETILCDCAFILFRTPVKIWTPGGYTETEPGTGMIWLPGMKQQYSTKEHTEMVHDFVYINFDTESEHDIIKDIPVCTPIYFANTEPVIAALKAINTELFANTRRKYKYEILPRFLEILFYRIRNEIDFQGSNTENNPHYEEICNLRKYIYNNVKADWTLESMSSFVHLSPSYFQSLYKQIFGISATNDVIRARIASAKSMLSYSSHKISTVAEECGYKNVEHFIRQFKKNTGVTPNKYRNPTSIQKENK